MRIRAISGRAAKSAFTLPALCGALLAASAAPAQSDEPTGGESFAASFAPFTAGPATITVPPHAVDLATITPPAQERSRILGRGVASYYAARFAGRRTASGETFDPRQLTAAHRTLPFGSLVRVTNPRNGRSVVVRINDRGPFTRGREIDLSPSAAEQVGIIQAGHGTVELALLER